MKKNVSFSSGLNQMFTDTRYAALLLEEVNSAPLLKRSLRFPLALACSVSEYYPLVFPMKSSASRIIDSAFDEALKYLDRGGRKILKDFVTNSKGILYAKDLTAEERARVLECAALILTTDENIERVALENRLPHVFISRCYRDGLNVRARYLKGDYYEQLRLNLAGCIEASLRVAGVSGAYHYDNGRPARHELIGESPPINYGLWFENRD
jgi:hypothetical protein